LVWSKDENTAQVKSRRYSIDKFSSVAYNEYKIVVPAHYRASDRLDVVIHECVHFLQVNSLTDESNYIRFNGVNYKDYLTQRSELEAHTVQIAYLLENLPAYVGTKLTTTEQHCVQAAIEKLKLGQSINCFLPALEICVSTGLVGPKTGEV
jgi:hypothetical protein